MSLYRLLVNASDELTCEIVRRDDDCQLRTMNDDAHYALIEILELVMGTGTWVMLDKFKFYQKNLEV